jgi:hypothetical protein
MRDFRYHGTTVEFETDPPLLPICHFAHGFLVAAHMYGHTVTDEEAVTAAEYYVGKLAEEDYANVVRFLEDQGRQQ